MALPANLVVEFDELVTHYPSGHAGRRSGLIPALHRCQEELGGWISPETMEDVAAYFELEPVEVYGVVSFYPMFRLTPPGKHLVSVCHNVSCDLRGARDVLREVCNATGVERNGHHAANSPDGKWTVETVECQGACANAPMFVLDGEYHEDLDETRVREILAQVGRVNS